MPPVGRPWLIHGSPKGHRWISHTFDGPCAIHSSPKLTARPSVTHGFDGMGDPYGSPMSRPWISRSYMADLRVSHGPAMDCPWVLVLIADSWVHSAGEWVAHRSPMSLPYHGSLGVAYRSPMGITRDFRGYPMGHPRKAPEGAQTYP